MQVNMAQKASGIEDRRMKTSPFERGEYFISSDARYKKPGARPGSICIGTTVFAETRPQRDEMPASSRGARRFWSAKLDQYSLEPRTTSWDSFGR